jgi:hypothetical protein
MVQVKATNESDGSGNQKKTKLPPSNHRKIDKNDKKDQKIVSSRK